MACCWMGGARAEFQSPDSEFTEIRLHPGPENGDEMCPL